MSEKISVLGMDGKVKESIDIPKVFSLVPRLDLIQRVVASIEAAQKQPQGRDPLAGKRTTAESWGTGNAVARIPRVKGSGFPTARGATFAPRTVGGRLAHPPRSEKIITKKVNKKEKHIALLSAISATQQREFILNRGHILGEINVLPIVIDDKFQALRTTSQVLETLDKIGLSKEIERIKEKRTIRSGKGKTRGRKYRQPKGPLIIVKDNFGIYNAARNIAGVEVVNIDNLNCELLAPGTHPGRLTIWTQSAFNALNKM
jgi:large subunit ribosomal protein L4e